MTKSIVISGEENFDKDSSESFDLGNIYERINFLEQKTENLNNKAKDIETSIQKSERQQDKALNFMMTISGIIVFAFFLAGIPIFLDYFKNNYTNRVEQKENTLRLEREIFDINYGIDQLKNNLNNLSLELLNIQKDDNSMQSSLKELEFLKNKLLELENDLNTNK